MVGPSDYPIEKFSELFPDSATIRSQALGPLLKETVSKRYSVLAKWWETC